MAPTPRRWSRPSTCSGARGEPSSSPPRSTPATRAIPPSCAGGPSSRVRRQPHTAAAQYRCIFGLDARSVLPTIGVPTLVLHRSNFSLVPMEHGRYLAEHIPDAILVEVAGGRRLVLRRGRGGGPGRGPGVPHRRRFQSRTGCWPHPVHGHRGFDRACCPPWDGQWHDLLDRHHAVIRTELDRHRGHEVKTTGDGFLATFDGPARARPLRSSQELRRVTPEAARELK
jgi:hypothetical protein